MDKKKLSEMIDGIDNRYLAESEKPYQKESGRGLGRVFSIACVAILACAIIGGIVLKLSKLKPEGEAVAVGETTTENTTMIDVVQESAETTTSKSEIVIPDKTEYAFREMVSDQRLNGALQEDLIAAWGEPEEIKGQLCWTAEKDGETRYVFAYVAYGAAISVSHSVPMYISIIDDEEKLAYLSWEKDKYNNSGLIHCPTEDVFGNQIDIKNGELYVFQTTGMVEESLPGHISEPYIFEKLGYVPDYEYENLKNSYAEYLAEYRNEYSDEYWIGDIIDPYLNPEYLQAITGVANAKAVLDVNLKIGKKAYFWMGDDEEYDYYGVYCGGWSDCATIGKRRKGSEGKVKEFENKKTIILYKLVEEENEGRISPVFSAEAVYEVSWDDEHFAFGTVGSNIMHRGDYLDNQDNISEFPVVKDSIYSNIEEDGSHARYWHPIVLRSGYSEAGSDTGIFDAYDLNGEWIGDSIEENYKALMRLGMYSSGYAVINEDGSIERHAAEISDGLNNCTEKALEPEQIHRLLFPMYYEEGFDKNSALGKDLTQLLNME